MNKDNGEQPERFVSEVSNAHEGTAAQKAFFTAFPALSDEVTDTDYPGLVIEALVQVLKADAGNRADSDKAKAFSRLPRR